ncbi:MAG: hypothetical protein RR500_05460 [Bacilli bacterium]
MKVLCRRILQFFVISAVCISVFNVSISNLSANGGGKENSQKQIEKVGWFEKSSTFLSNYEGVKTGYGYDYLQELARFGDGIMNIFLLHHKIVCKCLRKVKLIF